jgi:hypothetical protein
MTNHYLIGVRVFALIGALTLASLGASAADTVIGFDDLPPNTVVTNQYASAGVVFEAPPGCRVPLWRTIIRLPGGVARPLVSHRPLRPDFRVRFQGGQLLTHGVHQFRELTNPCVE